MGAPPDGLWPNALLLSETSIHLCKSLDESVMRGQNARLPTPSLDDWRTLHPLVAHPVQGGTGVEPEDMYGDTARTGFT